MEYSLDRPRSPRYRRSRSPPPRGTTGGSRREREERRRYEDTVLPQDSGLRDDRSPRRTENDESYSKHGTRDDRKQDSRLSLGKRDDGGLKKTRFEDTRGPIGETATIKNPLSASSTKQASVTQSSNSSSPARTAEQTGSQKASHTSQVVSSFPIASETSNEGVSAKPDVISNVALQEIPLPRSIIANIDAELETRPISAEESKRINGIWDHRVGTLAKLQDLLVKKDELASFLNNAKGAQPARQDEPGQFQTLIERLEEQIQKADVLITDLWQELVGDELNLIQTLGHTIRTATEHERLRNAEKSIIAMEKQSGILLEDDRAKEKDERPATQEMANPKGGDLSEFLPLEDLKIDDLEDQLRVREAELHEMEFGFSTEEFQTMVHKGLKKLKRHGRIGSVSGPALSAEEEKLLDELGDKLATVESWCADYDTRIGRRDMEELAWSGQYEQALNKIESASNAVVMGNSLLQQAETRLEGVKLELLSVQDAEQKVQKLAEEVSAESSPQIIEQHWRQLLDATRLETRGALDQSLNDFKLFLREVEEEDRTTWEQNERKLFEEVAQKLEKTFKWQDAVVKWLEKEKKSRLTL